MYTKSTIYSYLVKVMAVAMIVLFIASGCSGNKSYETGLELLKGKKYTEAIAEFQKVPTGEKNFRLAQSKINYIQGVMAFDDSLFSAAELRLEKVEADDEYFHDSQLMIDKILQRNKITEAPKTDTLIIREEVTGIKGREKETEKETVKAKTDAEMTAAYVKQTKNLIDQFESLYQSGYKASVESKSNYLSNMSSVSGKLRGLSYNAKEKDAEAMELNKKAASWMNKRIEFISRLIKDNSAAETNTSRSIKEEGDKLYYAVNQQMKKVN